MSDASFPKTVHLRRGKDFERVYALKCKAADGVLLLFVARNDQSETRIGLSVSRKHGGAVVRNRLKRWLREAFRLQRGQIPLGFDLVAIPLAADRASLSSYCRSLTALAKMLIRRLEQSSKTAEPPS